MAFTFPADKLDFKAPNGITYTYQDDKWMIREFGVTANTELIEILDELNLKIENLPLHLGDDPPDDPSEGDLWFDTSNSATGLQLYVYYNSDWVVASPPTSLDHLDSALQQLDAIVNQQGNQIAGLQSNVYQIATQTDERFKEFKKVLYVGADTPPEATEEWEQYQFWYKTNDEALYVWVEGEWVVAIDKVETPTLDSVCKAGNSTSEKVFFTEPLGVGWDAYEPLPSHAIPFNKYEEEQQEQDGLIEQNYNYILELEEEIEALAPSLDRGKWQFTTDFITNADNPKGMLNLQRYVTEEDREQAEKLCQAQLDQCLADPNNNQSNCNRDYNRCMDRRPDEGLLVNSGQYEKSLWALVANVDANGALHEWKDVSVGDYLEIFSQANASYMVTKITKIEATGSGADGYTKFEYDILQSFGVPSEFVRLKIFTLDDQVDITNYLRKTGDTMTGVLTMDVPAKKETGSWEHSLRIKGWVKDQGGNLYWSSEFFQDKQSPTKNREESYVSYKGPSTNATAILSRQNADNIYVMPDKGNTFTKQNTFKSASVSTNWLRFQDFSGTNHWRLGPDGNAKIAKLQVEKDYQFKVSAYINGTNSQVFKIYDDGVLVTKLRPPTNDLSAARLLEIKELQTQIDDLQAQLNSINISEQMWGVPYVYRTYASTSSLKPGEFMKYDDNIYAHGFPDNLPRIGPIKSDYWLNDVFCFIKVYEEDGNLRYMSKAYRVEHGGGGSSQHLFKWFCNQNNSNPNDIIENNPLIAGQKYYLADGTLLPF